jgi:hypothetical protein
MIFKLVGLGYWLICADVSEAVPPTALNHQRELRHSLQAWLKELTVLRRLLIRLGLESQYARASHPMSPSQVSLLGI